jgi:HJR/Mrr/RecB family endonuclease
MSIEFKLAYSILLFYAAFLIKKSYNYIKLREFYTVNIKRLKQGIIQIEDLHELTPTEFEHWCGSFLDKEGFYNIYVTPKDSDDGKDIICRKTNEVYYVECNRFVLNQATKYQIDVEIVKQLIGSMVSDKITNGIIITSGIFTKEAINYIETLPKLYKVLMYNGKDLVNDYNTLNKLLLCEQ